SDAVTGRTEQDLEMRQLQSYVLNHPVRPVRSKANLSDCRRLVIFNTNSMTVAQAWNELKAILNDESFSAIKKMSRVSNGKHRPRLDLWVNDDAALSLIRVIHTMTRNRTYKVAEVFKGSGSGLKGRGRGSATSGWRVSLWQSWRDRNVEPPEEDHTPSIVSNVSASKRPRCTKISFASWNVNGFRSKKIQVEDMVHREKVAVLALQETLVEQKQYPVIIDGYNTYAVPKQEGFRGQALLVDNDLSSYELPHDESKHWIHVKVSGLLGVQGPVNVFAGYLPSGGAYAGERTRLFNYLLLRCENILKKEPGALILVMGDLNRRSGPVDKALRKRYALTRYDPTGSDFTRWPLRGKPSSLDHMLVSPRVTSHFKRPRVLRQYEISDHRPIVSVLRIASEDQGTGKEIKTFRYDTKAIVKHGEEMANHNRWAALDDINIDSAAKLEQAAELFEKTSNSVMRSLGIKKDVKKGQQDKLPRKLTELLKRYKECSETLYEALEKRGPTEGVELKYREARQHFRKEKKVWARGQKQKNYARITDDFIAHDQKSVWRRLRSQLETRQRGNALPPIRDRTGKLQVELKDILGTMADHFKVIAQDDPDETSRKPDKW
ncbi:DNase I-like protein, partial [Athelia psychrophila]